MEPPIEIGTVKKVMKKEELEIDWEIENFFSIVENGRAFCSPAFVIADTAWNLKLYTHNFLNKLMYLNFISNMLDSVECSFGLKKSDGSVEQKFCGTLKRTDFGWALAPFIDRTEVIQRKLELAPLDVLTIKCIFKGEFIHTSPATSPAALEENPFKLQSLDRLSENYKDLFNNKETCDMTLKVKDKEYKAHRAILIARVPVFAAMFKYDTSERQTGIIDIPDCDPDSFQEFLEYLYSGKLEKISFRSACHLYVTSDKYEVLELKTFCVEYLKHCLTVENICDVVALADQYNEVELFSAVQSFFNKNTKKIFETSQWERLLENDYHLANKLLKEMANVKL